MFPSVRLQFSGVRDLQRLVRREGGPVLRSVVFFIGDCEFKTRMPPNVLRGGLCGYIKSFQEAGDILARLTEAKTAPVIRR